MLQILSFLYKSFSIGDLEISIINIILAVILIIFGIFFGIILKKILRRSSEKANLKRTISPSFIDLFLNVIQLSVYIIFINLALKQLDIPKITSWITSILIVFPALVGALVLIAVGFAIAVYLRDLIEESEIVGWQTLSMILFYFVIYVFMIFAIKTALISQDKSTVNIIMIVFTVIVSVAVAYWHVKIRK